MRRLSLSSAGTSFSQRRVIVLASSHCSSFNISFKIIMPLKITPSKKPLPVAKRSSLRNRSYEVEPVSGRIVYPSREYQQPIRPPPLSDQEAAAFQTSRSVLRYDPAQSPPEIAPDNSMEVNQPVLLSDPSQSPPEIAQEQSVDNQLSWQTTTSRRSARASRNVVVVRSAQSWRATQLGKVKVSG